MFHSIQLCPSNGSLASSMMPIFRWYLPMNICLNVFQNPQLLSPSGFRKTYLSRKIYSPVVLDSSLYVLYTSGSTGLPEGVLMSHRTIANLLTLRLCSSLSTVQHT